MKYENSNILNREIDSLFIFNDGTITKNNWLVRQMAFYNQNLACLESEYLTGPFMKNGSNEIDPALLQDNLTEKRFVAVPLSNIAVRATDACGLSLKRICPDDDTCLICYVTRDERGSFKFEEILSGYTFLSDVSPLAYGGKYVRECVDDMIDNPLVIYNDALIYPCFDQNDFGDKDAIFDVQHEYLTSTLRKKSVVIDKLKQLRLISLKNIHNYFSKIMSNVWEEAYFENELVNYERKVLKRQKSR